VRNGVYKTPRIFVQGIDSRGFGFVEFEGEVFSFKGYLPGDEVIVSFCEGKPPLPELINPSPDRIKPDCPYHGPCGGCDLLGLSEKARIKAKENLIKRTLSQIPGTETLEWLPFVPSRFSVRYRPRVRLHQGRNPNFREAGFLPTEDFKKEWKTGIVPIDSCLLITKPLARRLKIARKAFGKIPLRARGLYLAASCEGEEKVAGHLVLEKGWTPKRSRPLAEKFMREARLSGLSLSRENSPVEEVLGSTLLYGLIAPKVRSGPFVGDPAVFSQGNVFQNPKLIEVVMDFCKIQPGNRVMEGFAGGGNFTVPLALKGAKVEAFEANPDAVRILFKNIGIAEIREKVQVVVGDAQKEMALGKPLPDVLLLDPPREGIPKIGKLLDRLNPRRLVYVSCDLVSLSRDIGEILKKSYIPIRGVGMDLYPRTSHVETILLFEKS